MCEKILVFLCKLVVMLSVSYDASVFFAREIGSIGCWRWVCRTINFDDLSLFCRIMWRFVFVLCFTWLLISFRWAWRRNFFESKENVDKVVWRVDIVILRLEGTCGRAWFDFVLWCYFFLVILEIVFRYDLWLKRRDAFEIQWEGNWSIA